jgi:hypothetical protein
MIISLLYFHYNLVRHVFVEAAFVPKRIDWLMYIPFADLKGSIMRQDNFNDLRPVQPSGSIQQDFLTNTQFHIFLSFSLNLQPLYRKRGQK